MIMKFICDIGLEIGGIKVFYSVRMSTGSIFKYMKTLNSLWLLFKLHDHNIKSRVDSLSLLCSCWYKLFIENLFFRVTVPKMLGHETFSAESIRSPAWPGLNLGPLQTFNSVHSEHSNNLLLIRNKMASLDFESSST